MPEIAAKDGYDVRTVRKHVEIARQERESREARSIVLRNALEEHYRDLCKYAEHLRNDIGKEGKVSFDNCSINSTVDEVHMEMALHQHLPKSSIWKNLKKLEKRKSQLETINSEINLRVNSEIMGDPQFKKILANDEKPSNIDGIREAVVYQLKAIAEGRTGFDILCNFRANPSKEGRVLVESGSFHLGEFKEEHVQSIKKIINDIQKKAIDWEELGQLKKVTADKKSIEHDLTEELAVIIHRRVVPGRCRYCPI